jgi:drug/metabolite transporter (DMT)-like permease
VAGGTIGDMIDDRAHPALNGALYGLAAAALFGATVPLAKALLGEVQPFVLAGLFYLGSGFGLAAWRLISVARGGANVESSLKRADFRWLAAAILFGGVFAPLLLMYGLRTTPASGASLLLNLEGAFGAVIAWIVFHEHANRRVVLGMILLTLGAMLLSVRTDLSMQFAPGAICVILACLCWGVDNNLTRKISGVDRVQIAGLKGLIAGGINLAIGLLCGGMLPAIGLLSASLLIGFFGYGLSLVLYIFGLRHVGAARTSAYFSAAPFIGAAASIVFLHESVSVLFGFAAILMAAGLWLHLTEKHAHIHTHAPLKHDHSHVHDEHHQHSHAPGDPAGEPHSHEHIHAPVKHSHEHMPDIHHLHSHDD